MTLSLCMVVRDEVDALPRFLEAVRGCWDELCVIDTGSNDGTVALLEEAGAQVQQVPWNDDFAAARNASLALATSDWVLILDPDELPADGFALELRSAISRDEVGAFLIPFRNLLDGGHHRDCSLLRLFRLDATVRFEHAIHEDAGRSVRAMLSASGRTSSVLTTQVVHEGYLRARATSKGKQERDRRILTAAIDRDPGDLYLRFKLLEQARFWNDTSLLEQTAATTIAALAEPGHALAEELPRVPWGGELLTLLAEGAGRTPAEQLELLAAWSPVVQPGPALLLRRAELLERTGRLDEAADGFRSCLVAEDDGTIQRTTSRPLLGLVRIALLQGQTDEARGLCQRALDCAPDDPEAQYAAQILFPER